MTFAEAGVVEEVLAYSTVFDLEVGSWMRRSVVLTGEMADRDSIATFAAEDHIH
jgi:hypothetical protein